MSSMHANAYSQQPIQTIPVSPEIPEIPIVSVDPYSPTAIILAISVLIRVMKQK